MNQLIGLLEQVDVANAEVCRARIELVQRQMDMQIAEREAVEFAVRAGRHDLLKLDRRAIRKEMNKAQ